MSVDALIIEDGTGKVDSTSYVSVDEFLSYIDNRQLSITTTSDHDHVASLLIRANDYIESKRQKFQGSKTSETQALQFPRTGVCLDETLLESDAIPLVLKNAQIRLAYDLDKNSLDELSPVVMPNATGNIIKKKVDSIEIAYDNSGSKSNAPYYAEATNLLKPLFKASGQFFSKA